MDEYPTSRWEGPALLTPYNNLLAHGVFMHFRAVMTRLYTSGALDIGEPGNPEFEVIGPHTVTRDGYMFIPYGETFVKMQDGSIQELARLLRSQD